MCTVCWISAFCRCAACELYCLNLACVVCEICCAHLYAARVSCDMVHCLQSHCLFGIALCFCRLCMLRVHVRCSILFKSLGRLTLLRIMVRILSAPAAAACWMFPQTEIPVRSTGEKDPIVGDPKDQSSPLEVPALSPLEVPALSPMQVPSSSPLEVPAIEVHCYCCCLSCCLHCTLCALACSHLCVRHCVCIVVSLCVHVACWLFALCARFSWSIMSKC